MAGSGAWHGEHIKQSYCGYGENSPKKLALKAVKKIINKTLYKSCLSISAGKELINQREPI